MIIIKNGTIVNASGSFIGDVWIEDGKIVREDDTADAKVIDATGKLVFPGFIDAHTHFDLHVAGTVTADDFQSGTKAAIAGGTTTIIDFGTAYPGETLTEGLKNWKAKAAAGVSCDFGTHMTITDWNEDIKKECQVMMDEGVTTFKIYMTYDIQIDDKTVYEVLVRLKELGAITGCHCENAGMIDALRDAYASDERIRKVSSHYLTRPANAEAEAINRYLYLAAQADAPVIDVHLTCKEGLQEIREARKRGVKVYAETCPQYLLFDRTRLDHMDFTEAAKFVCAPPLREKEDIGALWEALAAGEIQTVCTDHCSFTTEQKALGRDDFRKIPGGLPGVETRALLLYSEGVAKGRITKEQMAAVCAENVARLYGLYPEKGEIREGADADLFLLDPEKQTRITAKTQVSKSDYAPCEGMVLQGAIEEVFLRGEVVAKGGQVIRENTGRFVHRHKPEYLTL